MTAPARASMPRRLVEHLYYLSALYLPLGGQYIMSARFYFEYCETPEFEGWPWRWKMNWPEEDYP